MKVISWNVKGLIDPRKSRSINKWLREEHSAVDFICLQEIKTSWEIIKKRLSTVHSKLKWLHMPNNGAATIGVSSKFEIKEILCSEASSPNCIRVRLGGSSPFTIISIHAGGNAQVITNMWKELRALKGAVILSRDFNMVEFRQDRWEGKGIVLKGGELEEWERLKVDLDLTNLGGIGEFTWKNYSAPPLAQKARLDRTYVLQIIASIHVKAKASPSYSTRALDHYPLITKARW